MKQLKQVMLAGVAALGISSAANAQIVTDFVFMVDESGSMGTVQTNLRNNIPLFAQILSDGGINATYALVGFGASDPTPRLITDLTNPANFQTAAQDLEISGGIEPGFTASAFALNQIDGQTDTVSFRSGSLKNLVVFSDEASNGDGSYGLVGGSTPTQALVDSLLKADSVLYNAVVSGGGASTGSTGYAPLATDNGGQVFDLNLFASLTGTALEEFVADFAAAKLEEIQDFCDLNPTDPACTGGNGVPAPGTLLLLGVGLLGLRARRLMARV